MRLVYLSPVPWFSYSQRPHYFVNWFHEKHGGDVLWVDPYPTRLPALQDAKYSFMQRNHNQIMQQQRKAPAWLTVLIPRALPAEPLPGGKYLNRLLWRSLFMKYLLFTEGNKYVLVIGKPSELALQVLLGTTAVLSIYDAMDNFPSFYTGMSRISMKKKEVEIASRVSFISVSSTALMEKFSDCCEKTILLHNACSPSSMPPPELSVNNTNGAIFGYVGTIGHWFDWRWVITLAENQKNSLIRLIGPAHASAPSPLPRNIELLSPCDHEMAIRAMQEFSVGLIPFKCNELTTSVDPIKYYEYRAMGLPVLSTCFGEMRLRLGMPGVFVVEGDYDLNHMARKALAYKYNECDIKIFREQNSWTNRFNESGIFV